MWQFTPFYVFLCKVSKVIYNCHGNQMDDVMLMSLYYNAITQIIVDYLLHFKLLQAFNLLCIFDKLSVLFFLGHPVHVCQTHYRYLSCPGLYVRPISITYPVLGYMSDPFPLPILSCVVYQTHFHYLSCPGLYVRPISITYPVMGCMSGPFSLPILSSVVCQTHYRYLSCPGLYVRPISITYPGLSDVPS